MGNKGNGGPIGGEREERERERRERGEREERERRERRERGNNSSGRNFSEMGLRAEDKGRIPSDRIGHLGKGRERHALGVVYGQYKILALKNFSLFFSLFFSFILAPRNCSSLAYWYGQS